MVVDGRHGYVRLNVPPGARLLSESAGKILQRLDDALTGMARLGHWQTSRMVARRLVGFITHDFFLELIDQAYERFHRYLTNMFVFVRISPHLFEALFQKAELAFRVREFSIVSEAHGTISTMPFGTS
jgi:hypothetical protein